MTLTKTRIVSALALLACAGAGSYGAFTRSVPAASSKITGDYIEARTAAVFAGACHYNGELVTTGNDAIMAWNFQSGTWHGVNLAGVRAMAVVTSGSNLGDATAARKSELLVDTSASDAQTQAVADLIRARSGRQLGTIADVRRGSIAFSDVNHHYEVSCESLGSMTVDPMPNDECCKQPNDVWYSPLNPVPNRKVGFTSLAAYTAGTIAEPWQRVEENSAFYGQFEF
jgi:hypothetical protein